MIVILKMMYMGKNFFFGMPSSWFSIKNKQLSLTAVILSAPAFLCLYFLAFRNALCLPFEIFRLARQVFIILDFCMVPKDLNNVLAYLKKVISMDHI